MSDSKEVLNDVDGASVDRVVMTRIADALERIAFCLESRKPDANARESRKPGSIYAEWVALAERAIAGEKIKSIAESLGKYPAGTRTQILKVFQRRNPVRYQQLREARDYGCTAEPSMRLLIANAKDFGFPSS